MTSTAPVLAPPAGPLPRTGRPLRLCILTSFIYQGGAQRFVIELARDAALRGHHVTLLLEFPTDEPAYFGRLPENVRIEYISPRRWRADGNPYGLAWQLRRGPRLLWWLARRGAWLRQFDVVHVVATYLLPYLMVRLRELTGGKRPRFIESYTGAFIEGSQRQWDFLLGRFWPHVDAVASQVDTAPRRAVNDRLPHLRMPVIGLGVAAPGVETVSAEERLAYRRAAGIPDDCQHVVGAVQRLHPTRRPWETMEVFAAIARRVPDAHFIQAGDGPARAETEARAAELGIGDRVHFLGSQPDVRYPFAIMDLQVIQVWEGGIPGASGYEAALSGVPSVGIDFTTAGFEATEDDFIWSSGDMDAVGARGAALLCDPSALQAEAERQLALATERVSMEACGAAYDRLYSAVARR